MRVCVVRRAPCGERRAHGQPPTGRGSMLVWGTRPPGAAQRPGLVVGGEAPRRRDEPPAARAPWQVRPLPMRLRLVGRGLTGAAGLLARHVFAAAAGARAL